MKEDDDRDDDWFDEWFAMGLVFVVWIASIIIVGSYLGLWKFQV